MPFSAFLLDFLKEDQRERKGVNRMGRKTRVCPFIARNINHVGEMEIRGTGRGGEE